MTLDFTLMTPKRVITLTLESNQASKIAAQKSIQTFRVSSPEIFNRIHCVNFCENTNHDTYLDGQYNMKLLIYLSRLIRFRFRA